MQFFEDLANDIQDKVNDLVLQVASQNLLEQVEAASQRNHKRFGFTRWQDYVLQQEWAAMLDAPPCTIDPVGAMGGFSGEQANDTAEDELARLQGLQVAAEEHHQRMHTLACEQTRHVAGLGTMQHLVPYRVAVLGDPKVGKSSLVQRFTAEQQPACKDGGWAMPTKGVDLSYKLVRSYQGADGGFPVDIMLEVHDFAGLGANKTAMPRELLEGWHVVLIVFDVQAADSFAGALEWGKMVHQAGRGNAGLFLVGNKADVPPTSLASFLRHPLKSTRLDKICTGAHFRCWNLVSAHSGAGCEDLWHSAIEVLLQAEHAGRFASRSALQAPVTYEAPVFSGTKATFIDELLSG